jgi:hypothetical protein
MIKKALVAAAFLTVAAPALAQNVSADAQKLAALLTGAGYQGQLGTDSTGDPMITSGTGGTRFVVLFYNCTNHQGCTTIQFQTAWGMKVKPSLSAINEWNRKHRFARAYLDDVGDPGLMMDVNLDKGGMSPDLFRDNLGVWFATVDAFKRQIGQ